MKKAVLEQILEVTDSSISVECITLPHFISTWHFHTFCEVILFTESTGTGFIGDSICPFEPGTVSVIGEKLPHVWLNGEEYYRKSNDLVASAVVIRFRESLITSKLSPFPELGQLSGLMSKAARGIVFSGESQRSLGKRINLISSLDGLSRFLAFLDLLNLMNNSNEYNLIASTGFKSNLNKHTTDKVGKVYEFIMHNFRRDLRLEMVADFANMSPGAFCRFFKKCFLKTFKEFLNEIRVGYASKLMIYHGYTASRAASEAGFNNMTHFHRQFKKYMRLTPIENMKKFQKNSLVP